MFIQFECVTPLGRMRGVVDDTYLFFLEFLDQKDIEKQICVLEKELHQKIVVGHNPVSDLVVKELDAYFAGTLQYFSVPIWLMGSEFYKKSWNYLLTISYGKTHTYKQQAASVANEDACRAVAKANSKNIIAIIVPCHRIIRTDGTLSGYAGGVYRKQWLLDHEQKNKRELE